MRRIYFETSALNYFFNELDFKALLKTRAYQKTKNREYLISTVTLWELMLTNDEKFADFLIYGAQNLFSDKLLATPTEILIRFLLNAYPENTINYDIYTEQNIGKIWKKMTIDNSVNFFYDKTYIKERTKHLRSISKNIVAIVNNSESLENNSFLKNIAQIVNVYYECLRDDGFLANESEIITPDIEIYFKTGILIVIVLMLIKQDMSEALVDSFWEKAGVPLDNPTAQMTYFFETYPRILHMGPIAEMTMMAHNQIKLGKTNRGLLLDCYHTIYTPYVDAIFTGDKGFNHIKSNEDHYLGKLWHISELGVKYVPFD